MFFDRVPKHLRARLNDCAEAGWDYWRVKAVLRDGRVFSNVFLTTSYELGFPDQCPFKAKDIVDFECTPHRTSSGVPVLESERREPPS
jgi:hypothetical protein